MTALAMYQSRGVSRRTRQALGGVAAQHELQYTEDRLREQRAAARISGITRVTRYGLACATLIINDTEMAPSRSAWGQSELVSLASTGIAGIRLAITDLAYGSS